MLKFTYVTFTNTHSKFKTTNSRHLKQVSSLNFNQLRALKGCRSVVKRGEKQGNKLLKYSNGEKDLLTRQSSLSDLHRYSNKKITILKMEIPRYSSRVVGVIGWIKSLTFISEKNDKQGSRCFLWNPDRVRYRNIAPSCLSRCNDDAM